MLYNRLVEQQIKQNKLNEPTLCNDINEYDTGWSDMDTPAVKPKYAQDFSALPHFTSGGMSIGKYYIVSYVTKEEIVRCNVKPVPYDSRNRAWKVSEKDMILLKLGIDFRT